MWNVSGFVHPLMGLWAGSSLVRLLEGICVELVESLRWDLCGVCGESQALRIPSWASWNVSGSAMAKLGFYDSLAFCDHHAMNFQTVAGSATTARP